MSDVGIIAEFNPFHNGHKHLLDTVKEKLNPDNIIVVMSGGFTMRGDLALTSKYERAKDCISGGADIVIELSPIYATAAAEQFAEGAIIELSKFENLDYLAFGSESGNIEELKVTSDILDKLEDDKIFAELIKINLKSGDPFMKIKNRVVESFSKNKICDMKKPNNLLALNYLQAINKFRLNLIPVTIKREDNENSESLNCNFPSASAIRKLISESKDPRPYLPDFVNLNNIADENIFSALRLIALKNKTEKELKDIVGVSEGLENRIANTANESTSFDEFLKTVKTKRYTLSRLKRIAICALADITNAVYEKCENEETVINVLAVKEEKKKLLSRFKDCKVITKYKDRKNIEDNTHLALIDKFDKIYEVCSKSILPKSTIFLK